VACNNGHIRLFNYGNGQVRTCDDGLLHIHPRLCNCCCSHANRERARTHTQTHMVLPVYHTRLHAHEYIHTRTWMRGDMHICLHQSFPARGSC
jgi:hypothetical protein